MISKKMEIQVKCDDRMTAIELINLLYRRGYIICGSDNNQGGEVYFCEDGKWTVTFKTE